MKTKKLLSIIGMTFLAGISTLTAQTSPTPWSLNTLGNYSFTSFSPAATSFPASMAIHQMSSNPVSLASTPVSDVPLPCTQTQAARTNVWGLNVQGIGLRSNPVQASAGYTNGTVGEVVVAVNATGRTNLQVSFKAGTYEQGTGQSSTWRLRCQYRVGSSGSWSELSGAPVEYTTVNMKDSVNMGPYTLPAAVDNQAVVQVRWVYYYVSGTWSVTNNRTHRAQLDDISVTSLPIVTLPAFAMTCPNSLAFALSGGTPSGGTYSGTGVSGGMFDPQATGPGNFSITYSYTDPFGMSNSANANMPVDYDACTTQLNSTWCGATNVNLDNTIFCDPVAEVQDYEWWFSNASEGFSVSKAKGNNYESFAMSAIPGIKYGMTYDVKIRAKILNQWRNWGPVCTITMAPSTPLTQLTPAFCGATDLAMSDIIYGEPVTGAIQYQYEFSDPGAGFLTTYLKNNNSNAVGLWFVSGLAYGKTYNVRIRSNVGGEWSDYGSVCTISMEADIPLTQLINGSCGATNLSLANTIYGAPVTGATKYQYEFSEPISGFLTTYLKNNNSNAVTLTAVAGLRYGTTYNVRIKSYVGGEWSDYGNTCTISTQPFPTTQLASGYCNTTGLTQTSIIYCDPVPGATDFVWLFVNSSVGYSASYRKGNGSNSFPLSKTSLQNNQTYTVQVVAQVGGAWGAWGPSCTITLGAPSRLAGTLAQGGVVIPTVLVFPNPTISGLDPKLRIEGAEGQTADIKIMDNTGKVVASYERTIKEDSFETELTEFPQLPAGIYFLHMFTGNTSATSKFIIE